MDFIADILLVGASAPAAIPAGVLAGTSFADIAECVAQGISAYGGAIWLGDPTGTNHSDGITLGDGALSGAGAGQPQAQTGHVSAVAIGNGANAAAANSTALGTGATACGIGGTALGANSPASTGVAFWLLPSGRPAVIWEVLGPRGSRARFS